jgi:hypothetical protein
VELPGEAPFLKKRKPEGEMAADSQNGDIIVLSFPYFSLIMMRVRAENQESGRSVGLLAASC